VVETRKRVLEPEHPDTLTSMNNLAMEGCARLLERALETSHPHFISSLNALAGWAAEQADAGALLGVWLKGQRAPD
jgi:hypothetical protein